MQSTYVNKRLNQSILNINDSRVKIINNSKNLGELKNMNSLLENAKGEYFTWQFDDDPCFPNFFREIVTAIKKYDNPECIFTNFQTLYGKQNIEINYNNKNNAKCFY